MSTRKPFLILVFGAAGLIWATFAVLNILSDRRQQRSRPVPEPTSEAAALAGKAPSIRPVLPEPKVDPTELQPPAQPSPAQSPSPTIAAPSSVAVTASPETGAASEFTKKIKARQAELEQLSKRLRRGMRKVEVFEILGDPTRAEFTDSTGIAITGECPNPKDPGISSRIRLIYSPHPTATEPLGGTHFDPLFVFLRENGDVEAWLFGALFGR